MLCKLIFMEKKSGDFTFCKFFFQVSKEKAGKLRRLLVVLVVSNFSLYRRRGDSVLGILVKQCTINPGPCINQDIYQAHPSLSYGKWRHDKVFAAVIKDSNLQRCSKCTIPSICSFRKSLRLIQVFFWLRLAVNTYFFEWASWYQYLTMNCGARYSKSKIKKMGMIHFFHFNYYQTRSRDRL